MKHTKKILIGADPELFCTDETGKLISSHGLVPGTKFEPFKVQHGAVQIDGTALEFNIDPAKNQTEFVKNIQSVMGQMQAMIGGKQFHIAPSVMYDEEYFKSVPEDAKELGCNPDYNAWTYSENPRPDMSTPLRTASGHVHVGWVSEGEDVMPGDQIAVVRELDYFLGIMSLDWDPDPTRRQLYGLAGAFRPKPYGVEYRVLSNAWLRSKDLMKQVYRLTKLGVSRAMSEDVELLHHKYEDLARNIIDNNITDWRQAYPALAQEMEALVA